MLDRPTPKRRPGFFSTTSFLRLAVCEAAIVGGMAMSRHVRPAAAVAVLLVATTVGRQGGRWWVDHRTITRRFRRRGAARPAGHQDRRISALRGLAPGLTIGDAGAGVGVGVGVGVGHDGAGWFAVAAIESDPDRHDAADQLIDDLAAMLRDCGIPGATGQLVTHTVPAPGSNLAPDCPAAVSYRELFALVGPIPAARTQWLAVRADAEVLAAAGVRDADRAPAIVAGLVRRAARAASRQGRKATVLDPDGLVMALAHSCGLDQRGEAAVPREEWSAWHCGPLAHRSFWLQDWPAASETAVLLDHLTVTRAAMTSLALVVRADPDTADVRCLLRVATRGGDLIRACDDLTETARTLGATLTALDGEQVPAAYASAPTGGGPA